MMLKAKSDCVVDLLVSEKQRAKQCCPSKQPLLTWRLANLNLHQNFCKVSDVFSVDGSQSWRLFISKSNDRECTIGLKFMGDMARHISLLSWVRISSSID